MSIEMFRNDTKEAHLESLNTKKFTSLLIRHLPSGTISDQYPEAVIRGRILSLYTDNFPCNETYISSVSGLTQLVGTMELSLFDSQGMALWCSG